ncbi:hypothetical protein K491DRAFT_712289 [Lophiostoma macrostomum CBS 122681]|uniref:Uncharacterized protein n=1 Tax=Lophiostoma macrostomum CBS 122681 TaxID=1314788 RepID=A0A6A6TLA7_9PLEO|nr:hypothetical protein K491DRAFT_712289 [Lophiostoma macrostomum CBS 122681]
MKLSLIFFVAGLVAFAAAAPHAEPVAQVGFEDCDICQTFYNKCASKCKGKNKKQCQKKCKCDDTPHSNPYVLRMDHLHLEHDSRSAFTFILEFV